MLGSRVAGISTARQKPYINNTKSIATKSSYVESRPQAQTRHCSGNTTEMNQLINAYFFSNQKSNWEQYWNQYIILWEWKRQQRSCFTNYCKLATRAVDFFGMLTQKTNKQNMRCQNKKSQPCGIERTYVMEFEAACNWVEGITTIHRPKAEQRKFMGKRERESTWIIHSKITSTIWSKRKPNYKNVCEKCNQSMNQKGSWVWKRCRLSDYKNI